MRHNPEKNRAVCVLAKSSVWGLRALLAISLLTIVGLAVLALVITFRDWSWAEAGTIAITFLIVAAFCGVLIFIGWLITKWYEWAKNYSSDC